MTDDTQKPTITATKGKFELAAVPAPTGNLPATIGGTQLPAAAPASGGDTYQNASPDERSEMDTIIASIDLTAKDSKSIINLGSKERNELGDLADQLLDSMDPSVKIKFAEAFKGMMDYIANNSLDKIKNRIIEHGFAAFKKGLSSLFSKPDPIEQQKEIIGKFMTDLSSSRTAITEMADQLELQKDALGKNYTRIDDLGLAFSQAEKRMRIVNSAINEFIRRVNSGENTILKDLAAKAAEGRSDDQQTNVMAQTNWGALQIAGAGAARSIGVYDKNIATLAFTKQTNVLNRIQTEMALANGIADWKADLALFGIGSVEKVAAIVISGVNQMNSKSVKSTQEVFEDMMKITIGNINGVSVGLREVVQSQDDMLKTLNEMGTQYTAQMDELAKAKEAVQESSAAFRDDVGQIYQKGFLGTAPAAANTPKPQL